MIEVDPFLDDKLIAVEREYKKTLNKISLILVFWILLISFFLFIGYSNENIKDLIFIFGAISLAPFLIYESIIFSRLFLVKQERKKLKQQKTLYEDSISH